MPSLAQLENREKQDKPPFIIPVFIPHGGCPHRCVFCDQSAITGTPLHRPDPAKTRRDIDTFLHYRRDPGRFTEIAFFGGNFLGLGSTDQQNYLRLAGEYQTRGMIHGIRFSTRPDTITKQSLDFIESFPVTTVELGAQSMDDTILARAGRGHRAADTRRAVAHIQQRGYRVGLQMMAGLPGDTRGSVLESGRRLAALLPAFVRIYPTVVLKGSPLAAWYRDGRYRPLDLDTAVDWVKALYTLFARRSIRVIRMGLPASRELDREDTLLAGPYHPAFGHLVQAALFYDRAVRLLDACPETKNRATFRLHPRSASQFRGLANSNLAKLKENYGITDIRITPDECLSRDALLLE